MGKPKKTKWNFDTVMVEMSKHSRKFDFQKASVAAYRFARINGMLNTYFLKDYRGRTVKWDVSAVTEEASKFTTRKEFSKFNRSAYNAAKKLEIIDSLFGFSKTQWSDETMRAEMMKFSTRSDFYKLSGSAYNTSLKKFKIMLDELLPVESDRNGCDNDAVYIWRVVGQFYNGNPVYKIGVTSHRLGTLRIKQVSSEMKSDYEIICCEKVEGKASDIERKLHLLGENPRYDGINGKTEFRALSDSALYAAISIICGSL